MKNNILDLPWVQFNKELMKITSDETVHRLIFGEQKGRKRTLFLMRLHQRYNKLRAQRERHALLEQSV